MSTTYHAIPKQTILDAGLRYLLEMSPRDLITEAVVALGGGPSGEEGVTKLTLDSPRGLDAIPGVLELGTFSHPRSGREFHAHRNVQSREQLEQMLDGNYVIIEAGCQVIEPQKFGELVAACVYRSV